MLEALRRNNFPIWKLLLICPYGLSKNNYNSEANQTMEMT